MKYRKFTKLEKKEAQAQYVANALHGEGLYLYRNRSRADLTLPRPTKSGKRSVGPNEEFQGDNYYMQLVRQGFLTLVKELQSPEQQRQAINEAIMQQEKLILDQPDMITESGKVEHVVKPKQQKLNEADKAKAKQPEQLLNEAPIAGDSFVIV